MTKIISGITFVIGAFFFGVGVMTAPEVITSSTRSSVTNSLCLVIVGAILCSIAIHLLALTIVNEIKAPEPKPYVMRYYLNGELEREQVLDGNVSIYRNGEYDVHTVEVEDSSTVRITPNQESNQ